MRRGNEGGESLVEILIAVVIIGLVMGAIFATYATAATSSKSQRDFVTADTVLRTYAETAKQAVRSTCTLSNAGTAVPVNYTPPAGFTVSTSPASVTCPAVTSVNSVVITVRLPAGSTRMLGVVLRTP